MQDCRPLSHRLHRASAIPARLLALGYPSSAEGGPNRWVLPLPATYVVDRNGRIVLSYVDTDYRTRLEPAEMILALGHLRAKATANKSF